MTNLDSILKIRDLTLPTKVHLLKAMFFPVVTYGCESWTIKKDECQRIDTFELWSWRRLLESWTLGLQGDLNSQSYRKSVLNSHWKDWCWSWSSNTLATSCEELTHYKRLWCWERLKAGEGDDRGWDGWMASLTQWTWVWASSGSWWWTGRPGMLRFMGSRKVKHYRATELIYTRQYCSDKNGIKSCHFWQYNSSGYYAKWNKSDRERESPYYFTYMRNLKTKTNEQR